MTITHNGVITTKKGLQFYTTPNFHPIFIDKSHNRFKIMIVRIIIKY
jgi:hypothetical protein